MKKFVPEWTEPFEFASGLPDRMPNNVEGDGRTLADAIRDNGNIGQKRAKERTRRFFDQPRTQAVVAIEARRYPDR